jgi:hypothetical protein
VRSRHRSWLAPSKRARSRRTRVPQHPRDNSGRRSSLASRPMVLRGRWPERANPSGASRAENPAVAASQRLNRQAQQAAAGWRDRARVGALSTNHLKRAHCAWTPAFAGRHVAPSGAGQGFPDFHRGRVLSGSAFRIGQRRGLLLLRALLLVLLLRHPGSPPRALTVNPPLTTEVNIPLTTVKAMLTPHASR